MDLKLAEHGWIEERLEDQPVQFRSVYATMIKEWLGYDDTRAVLKGQFAPLGAFG